jgi:hypothetical protein
MDKSAKMSYMARGKLLNIDKMLFKQSLEQKKDVENLGRLERKIKIILVKSE